MEFIVDEDITLRLLATSDAETLFELVDQNQPLQKALIAARSPESICRKMSLKPALVSKWVMIGMFSSSLRPSGKA
jgi:hypothetical protein